MSISVYLPLLFTALFGTVAPPLARLLPPANATWLLSLGGLLAAACSAASLALLGFTLVGQNRILAEHGGWSDSALRRDNPVPSLVAASALVLLGALMLATARVAVRRATALREAYRLAAALPDNGTDLAVLDDSEPHAFALPARPGRPGRIVVTTALLRRLDPTQRRALLAHERSHLIHRHHLHQSLAHLAAAANPMLRSLPAALEHSCERWADEDAAERCPRTVVADALVHAATPLRARALAVALAAGGADIAARVHALRAPAPRLTLWRVAVPMVLLTAAALTSLLAAHDTEQLFEFAQSAYRAGR